MQRTLGTCYYPEHWPQDVWAEDARRMVELGRTWDILTGHGWIMRLVSWALPD
jgi:beta-galactosidase